MKRLKHLLAAALILAAIGSLDRFINARIAPPPSQYPSKGTASWYVSPLTATGERYDPESLTCAMRRRDFGKRYRVCNPENGRCVEVRHNNWGPYWVLYNRGRIVDLSRRAFSEIADLEKGLVPVTVTEVTSPH
jgi:rare lipoprotein A